MKSYISGVVSCFFILFLSLSYTAQARHNDTDKWWGSNSALARKIKQLDKKEVKTFPVPILFGVSLKEITPDFGAPRGGGTRTHEGQDMLATKGTPIVSPTEAVVVSTGDGESSGKYVRTANPGGESFVYMHLDSIAKIKSGDVLRVGDLIGTVGDTGNAKGGPSHLHFEVKENGAQDPYPRLDEPFTLKEKVSFLKNMLKEVQNKKKFTTFLVDTYGSELKQAVSQNLALPKEIRTALEKKGIVGSVLEEKKLQESINAIPLILKNDIALGAEGSSVRLLQLYLVHKSTTLESSILARSGATGYFGPVTERALIAFQKEIGVEETGVWDSETRKALQ